MRFVAAVVGAPIWLRVGVHTGEVQLRDEGNYIGPAINRIAWPTAVKRARGGCFGVSQEVMPRRMAIRRAVCSRCLVTRAKQL